MSARDEILASIRRSLGVTGKEAPRRQIVQDRIERAPEGTIPARGQGSGEERLAVFKTQAEAGPRHGDEVPALRRRPPGRGGIPAQPQPAGDPQDGRGSRA